MTSLHYNFNDSIYITRGDGKRSRRYKHWCIQCSQDRGYAYKNKILKEPFCHSCKMKQPDIVAKISASSKNRTHSKEVRNKISKSLYNRYGSSPENRKISRNLRARLNKAVQKNYKSGSAVRDLGCSVEDFKAHIESKWTQGMSWDNYGRSGWHFDHVVPLCRFNLQDPIELKKACHYTNIQPMWASDNLAKRKKDGTYTSK